MIAWILFGVMSVLFIAALFFAIKFGLRLLQAQDAVEECLDELDVRYTSMSQIADMPLAKDSSEVRIISHEIMRARAAIHNVASILESDSGLYNIEPQDEDDDLEDEPEEKPPSEGHHYRKLIG